MKLHVQCDRCKKYAEANQDGYQRWANAPQGWFHLRAFGEPVTVNSTGPEGPVKVLLCGDCMPIVQRAVEGACITREQELRAKYPTVTR